MSKNWVVVKNAVANLARGGASGIVALFLPALLVRHMTQLDYAVWVLALQIAAYSGYLDFGLQTAIGRYIAFANEKQDVEMRNGIYSTAFVGLALAGSLCLLLLMVAACAASWIFPQIPLTVLPAMRWTLLILGSSLALGLPASAWNGIFVGLQRYEIPAFITGSTKVVSALAIVVVAMRGYSIIWMATVLAGFNIGSYIVLYTFARKYSPLIKFQKALVSWSNARELTSYCYGLTVWSFGMMLVTGLDLLLVGRFEISAVTPYALAASLVTFVVGTQTAIFSVMIPRAAVHHAQRDPLELGKMVLRSTKIGMILLICTTTPLFLFAKPIMTAWVGGGFATAGLGFLFVLLAANIIRLTALPYSVVLIGAGQQRFVVISPFLEGVTNLVASIILGMKFGAMGVAAGTLIGAVVGVLGNLLYNIPRTSKEIRLRPAQYFFGSICLPLVVAIPFFLIIVSFGGARVWLSLALEIGLLFCAFWFLKWFREESSQLVKKGLS